MSDWMIFQGDPKAPHDGMARIKDLVPPWRNFQRDGQHPENTLDDHRGRTYIPSSPEEIRLVNAALYLRRPLLVTGTPGSGKSSLAYAIAMELKLGRVLKWPINSRSTLTEGLYQYDAISRLRDANLEKPSAGGTAPAERPSDDISRYLNLQWLGTALASPTPRVLLIDEIDKADIDLPNDLLHVLEEGTFTIPELLRIADKTKKVSVRTCEPGAPLHVVEEGVVRCTTFPVIVITSNGERELPPAFHRRCLRLEILPPSKDKLEDIIHAHLKGLDDDKTKEQLGKLVARYLDLRQKNKVMATDQLLNLVYLLFRGNVGAETDDSKVLETLIFQGLNR